MRKLECKLECKAPPQPLLGRARGGGSLGERTSCALHQSLSQASAPRACPSLLADRRNALIMWALREVGFWWETQNSCCLSQINFQLLRKAANCSHVENIALIVLQRVKRQEVYEINWEFSLNFYWQSNWWHDADLSLQDQTGVIWTLFCTCYPHRLFFCFFFSLLHASAICPPFCNVLIWNSKWSLETNENEPHWIINCAKALHK